LKVKVLAADPAQVLAAIDRMYGTSKAPIPEPISGTKRRKMAEDEDQSSSKVDTVPIIKVSAAATPVGAAAAFTEIEEIVPAVPIGRAEYEEVARTPFGQLYRAWDDPFRDGKVIRAPRVG